MPAANSSVDAAVVVGTVTVDGSAVTQPVSAAALPLPAGASTEATSQGMAAALNELAWQAILQGERMMFA